MALFNPFNDLFAKKLKKSYPFTRSFFLTAMHVQMDSSYIIISITIYHSLQYITAYNLLWAMVSEDA